MLYYEWRREFGRFKGARKKNLEKRKKRKTQGLQMPQQRKKGKGRSVGHERSGFIYIPHYQGNAPHEDQQPKVVCDTRLRPPGPLILVTLRSKTTDPA